MMMKVSIPVEQGNAAAKSGKLGSTVQAILADLKPESAYFIGENGKRTGIIVFDMQKQSQIPAVAEPWFLAFNAEIELTPAMTPQDLAEAAPGIEKAVKAFGKSAGA